MILEHLFYFSVGILFTILFIKGRKIYFELKKKLKTFKKVHSNKNFKEIKVYFPTNKLIEGKLKIS